MLALSGRATAGEAASQDIPIEADQEFQHWK